jgi:nucleotidyltransferase substrate binding protein (TIGR01987 family)
MPQYKLDTTSLSSAIEQIEESLQYYHSNLVQADEKLALLLRAATIQAFEFTYELSLKMLKRYLELAAIESPEIDLMSFQNLIRTGCEHGLLLSDVAQWKQYRHDRSLTRHTYDQEKAMAVFKNIPEFLKEAKYLLEQLNKRAEQA